jgi:hypothetical protein
MFTINNLTCAGITIADTEWFYLVRHIVFKSRTVWVYVAKMNGITMSELCGIERRTVIVEGCRTEHNLVTSVTINITHGYTMCTLSVESFARSLALVEPFVDDVLAVKLHSPCVSLGVVATEEDGTWSLVETIKMCHTGKETVATVALKRRTVAPASTVVFRFTSNCEGTVRVIVNRMDSMAVKTREYGKELWTIENTSVSKSVSDLIVCLADILVRSSLAHKLSLAVLRARSRLADKLSLAVAVKVVEKELGIVSTGTDVRTEVDAP